MSVYIYTYLAIAIIYTMAHLSVTNSFNWYTRDARSAYAEVPSFLKDFEAEAKKEARKDCTFDCTTYWKYELRSILWVIGSYSEWNRAPRLLA